MIEKHGSLIYGTEDEIKEAIREKERQEPCVSAETMSRENSFYKHKYRELLKVIEDIKAEIHQQIDDVGNGAYSDGLYDALAIIDKHMKEAEHG